MKEASEQSEPLREAIRAAYQQGEAAVVALFESLLKAQTKTIAQLESRLEG